MYYIITPCRFYFQVHLGFSEEGRNKCFKCGLIGHLQSCCSSKVSLGENKILVATSSAPPSKGAVSNSSTEISRNCLYALTTCQYSKASPDVVNCMLRLFVMMDISRSILGLLFLM